MAAFESKTAESLQGKVAVVTGASSGIGKAIALQLAHQGATICVVGRRRSALDQVVATARSSHLVHMFVADLTDDDETEKLAQFVEKKLGRLDFLVHSAGSYGRGVLRESPIGQLDRLYRSNVRGPYLLTQLLLSLLITGRGHVVFVNSSQAMNASAAVGQYAATQHARKAIADSLRAEVNQDGVRVLSLFPGRTATPLSEKIFNSEGTVYEADRLLQPEDIADVVLTAITLPRTAEVTNLSIRPFIKSY